MLEGVAEGEEHLVALVADLHDVGNVIVQSGVAVNAGQEGRTQKGRFLLCKKTKSRANMNGMSNPLDGGRPPPAHRDSAAKVQQIIRNSVANR